MKNIVISIGVLTLIMLMAVSCEKEYSLENARPAIGSLQSNLTGECLPSLVNGVYKKDSALTSQNFITASIAVTAPGRCVVITDTVNGFYFKGESRADSAGPVTIKLSGFGKPVEAGDYTFHLKFGTTVCSVVVTVENTGAPTSVYTFTTATGGCPAVSFAGDYKVGVLLTAANTMEFDVNVTQAGTYNFALPAVNGITFSGSGTFAATGMQHVVLKGLGTPLTDGVISISTNNGTANCSNNLTVFPAGVIPDAVYTLTCSAATLNGNYTQMVPTTSLNTVVISAIVTTAGKYNISTTSVNGVTFVGTGTFSAVSTSPQQITLTASGTPTSKGPFSYPVTGNGSSCSFPVDYLAAPVPAVYSLSGAPGACTTPLISGTYAAGTALNTSNTVVIKANVTTAGTYSITTNTLNGIKFAATGSFTNVGLQDVTLTGTGTPIAGGTNNFTPQSGSACSFDITVTSPPVNAGIFTCKIDGVFTTFNDRAAFTHEADLFFGGMQLSLTGFTGPPTGNAVTDLKLFITNLSGSVTAGTYKETGLTTAKPYRIEVDYTKIDADFSSTLWNTSSNFLTTNPPFTIVVTSVSSTRVKGTFSGKVTNLNQGSTQQKSITEGVFDLPKE